MTAPSQKNIDARPARRVCSNRATPAGNLIIDYLWERRAKRRLALGLHGPYNVRLWAIEMGILRNVRFPSISDDAWIFADPAHGTISISARHVSRFTTLSCSRP